MCAGNDLRVYELLFVLCMVWCSILIYIYSISLGFPFIVIVELFLRGLVILFFARIFQSVAFF